MSAVTVIGNRPVAPFGPLPDSLVVGVGTLASAVGAGVLTATFSDGEGKVQFVGATPSADVTRDEVADAMLATLCETP